MAGQPDFNSEDYYKILGLPKTASEAEVNKAYKKLALKHHPDKNPDDKEQAEKRFKKISEAYSVLSDAEKKKTYDQFGKGGLNGGGGGPGGPHMNGAGFSAEDADKIFRMFFSGGDGGLGGFSMGGMPGGGGSRMVFMSNAGGPGMGGLGEGFGGFGDNFMNMNLGNMMGGGRGMRHPGAGRRAGSSARPEQCAIPKGTQVVIHGLAKAPQHNGRVGEVQRFDSQRARYDVAIEGGDPLALQPQNITQLQEIEIAGLTQKPELNGRHGNIVNYQDDSGRYRVSLDSSGPIALSPANCILREGTRVILRNLNNPKFSGEMAVITAVDREAGRYQVRCRSGEQIAVKFEKVTC